MKSKMSFFNKGIIISNIKRHGWVSAIWSILLFLAMPLTLMNFDLATKSSKYLENLINNGYSTLINRFGGIYSGIMLCVFPVLLGVLVFRYLHAQNSATVFHGLPFTRLRLFANALFSGFILILMPVILNFLIVTIIKSTMQIGDYLSYKVIFLWLVNTLSVAFCIFSLTVFVGMFTGNIITHIVFTYIIHFLPIMLWASVVELFDAFIYGYPYPSMPDFLEKFPMLQISHDTSGCNLVYFIAGLIMLVLAYLLYRKRPIETAGDVICFKFLAPVFKYSVTFCCAIFGYVLFADISGDIQKNIIALTFLIIGYAISQMLLSKTWRIWKSWKGLVISVIVLCILWGALEFDVTGYEKRIPSPDEITSIEIETALPGMDTNGILITDTEEIATIHSMHQSLIKNKKKDDDLYPKNDEMPRSSILIFKYSLNNGKTMRRSYDYIISDYKKFIEPLFYSENIRKQGMSILNVSADMVDKLYIYLYKDKKNNDSTTITDKEQIQEFINVYISDINEMTFDEAVYDSHNKVYGDLHFEGIKREVLALDHTLLTTAEEKTLIQYNRSYMILDTHEKTIEWVQKNLNK